MTKVFIDGSAGTTGLRIHERLSDRRDLELVILSDELRKDPTARKEAINNADVAFLCLPDPAAVEAVSMVENDHVAIIDTSTAHRTLEGWTYGFPELKGKREAVAASKRIANPGCHASGFVALIAPSPRLPSALAFSFLGRRAFAPVAGEIVFGFIIGKRACFPCFPSPFTDERSGRRANGSFPFPVPVP